MTGERSAIPILRAIAVAVVLAACDDGAINVELFDYDETEDEYVLREVAIETLTDVDRLQGRATVLVGGADMTLDYGDNTLTRDDPGHFVAFGAFEDDGVLIPEDFDSFAMASAYYNIERAMLFFEGLGMPRDLLVEMETYYRPKLEIVEQTGESEVMSDNAFYMYVSPKDRGFYVFPFEDFQWLPMAMNSGIMCHEFTHSVFDALVHDPNRTLVQGGMTRAGANFLYGLNEGSADFMAVASTGDPDYMEHSIEKGIFGTQCNTGFFAEIVRDASVPIEYTASLDTAARNVAPDAFCPYDIGAFVASALYATALEIDAGSLADGAPPSMEARRMVAKGLYETLASLGDELATDFELWDFFSILVSKLEAVGADGELCDTLQILYPIYYSEVAGC